MNQVLDVLSWVLLSCGGFFILVGGIGALRMPSFYTRMHAASVTDTMASFLVIGGLILQAGWSLATVKLVAIILFLMLTSPTSSYAVANAALLSGMKPDTKFKANKGGRES
ncbi:MAG: monovalent cation/H(+) antiporter subunit G [Cellvibrionaceae bacterium]|nr:monovalent cation/H(+) antiporter subunit G [Cellvibrionaceae bacterium]